MYYDLEKITQVGRIVNWLLPEKARSLGEALWLMCLHGGLRVLARISGCAFNTSRRGRPL